MKKGLTFLLLLLPCFLFAQGLSNIWLTGGLSINDSNVISSKARFNFYNGLTIQPENFKMNFHGSEANISDKNGNLLMSSNGIWIANSTGDTMLNGSGLNPNIYTNSMIGGMGLINGCVFLPFPNDSNKYVLLHESTQNYPASGYLMQLYYTIVDMTLDGGKGGVIQKNILLGIDSLGFGITACKHANGRDWWIVAIEQKSNIIHTILLNPQGISTFGKQHLGSPSISYPYPFAVFSPDGSKLAVDLQTTSSLSDDTINIRLFNFDRCTGIFSSLENIIYPANSNGLGLCFSSNSKYLYKGSQFRIYQINTDTSNITASLEMVAQWDSVTTFPPYNYPYGFSCFYLASDNKIYVTAGSQVLKMHYIDKPDSAGTSCNVQLNAISLPCYGSAAVPNHPNYFLGALEGSACDSLSGFNSTNSDQHLSLKISPNPAVDGFVEMYCKSTQNISGYLRLFDAYGKKVMEQIVAPNTSYKRIDTSHLTNGMYVIQLQIEECIHRAKLSIQNRN